jgi:predicted Fe-Mo cluster-binding NifX family protein
MNTCDRILITNHKGEKNMKICITSQGEKLESEVDPRFGRCGYFIVVDPDSMEFEAIENTNAQGMGGVGIRSAQLISEKGVKTVLTGNVGPNAFQTLNTAGIDIITGVYGVVKDAIVKYKTGELKPTGGPNVDSKFGMKSGA